MPDQLRRIQSIRMVNIIDLHYNFKKNNGGQRASITIDTTSGTLISDNRGRSKTWDEFFFSNGKLVLIDKRDCKVE